MQKSVKSSEQVPHAQLVIRAGDSRPVVITLQELGGHVDVSAGNSDDMVEATTVLHMMQAVCRSIGITRQIKEDHSEALKKLEDANKNALI